MKVALDSNVLAYAAGFGDDRRNQLARDLIVRLDPDQTVVTLQCLGELFNVLVRKARRSREAALTTVRFWSATVLIELTVPQDFYQACDLATRHQLSIWDAVIVAVSANAGCNLLLSEDMQDGSAWRGLTIVNPFAASPHPLLRGLLGG